MRDFEEGGRRLIFIKIFDIIDLENK